MAKDREQKQETWGSRMKDYGGGNFTFLGTDGETLTFIVVGLPEKIVTTYQKKEQERIGCPVVTEDGYQLFICGKRLARKLSKHEKKFTTNAFMVTRHGTEGDVNAKYQLTVLPEQETFKQLCAIRDEDFTPDMIRESVEEAMKTLGT